MQCVVCYSRPHHDLVVKLHCMVTCDGCLTTWLRSQMGSPVVRCLCNAVVLSRSAAASSASGASASTTVASTTVASTTVASAATAKPGDGPAGAKKSVKRAASPAAPVVAKRAAKAVDAPAPVEEAPVGPMAV